MNALKITLAIAATGFLALFGYANLRTLSPGERIKPVELSSFILHGQLDKSYLARLEKRIENVPGVKACSISAKGQTACIIYYKDSVSETELVGLLGAGNVSRVEKKDLSASRGGCPVHQVSTSFSKVLMVLDRRIGP